MASKENPENKKELLPNILVTGTPGVGKTTLCSLLEDQLAEQHDLPGYQYVKLAEMINTKKLYTEWNEEFDVPEFDEDMVCDELEPLMSERGGIILEFHSCDFFPERWFDLIVLLRCDNKNLFDRLQERGYKQNKIDENIQCEIFGELADEVYNGYKEEKILELKSNAVDDVETNIGKIVSAIKRINKGEPIHNKDSADDDSDEDEVDDINSEEGELEMEEGELELDEEPEDSDSQKSENSKKSKQESSKEFVPSGKRTREQLEHEFRPTKRAKKN